MNICQNVMNISMLINKTVYWLFYSKFKNIILYCSNLTDVGIFSKIIDYEFFI